MLWILVVLFTGYVLVSSYSEFAASLYNPCSDVTEANCNYLQIQTAQLPALSKYGVSLNSYAVYALICDLLTTLCLIGTGVLIFWRNSTDRMCLFVSLLLIIFGAFGMSEVHLMKEQPFAITLICTMIIIVKWPALGIFFCTFPDGRFVPHWSWLLIVPFILQLGFFMLPQPYNIENWPPLLSTLEVIIVYGGAAATQIYRFFVTASPQQRQQSELPTT